MKVYYTKLRGYKYRTAQDHAFVTPIRLASAVSTDYIQLTADGLLFIKKGYCWDGPSGPTVDGDTNLRGSLAHDALYQLMRLGLLPQTCRKQSDEYFVQLCKEDGMWGLRAWLDFHGLRIFGSSAAERSKEIETQDYVLAAPQ